MRGKPYLFICGLTALGAALLLWYSQTAAFAWDEGFHLLTAQLIKNGRRPYLDFFFPQTPLNAYWNAFWFRIFGDTWRTAHAAAALCTTAAILLTGDYVYRRYPVVNWRFAGALIAMFGMGMNAMIVEFGTVGQAYGLCLVSLLAAFRFAVLAVEEHGILLALVGGLFAGTASGATLLSVLAGPVMGLWILCFNRNGNRFAKLVTFGIGNAIPFTPILLFYLQKPKEVFFTVFEFNRKFRAVDWTDPYGHDLDVITSWLVSAQACALGILAIAGLFYILRRSEWERAQRAEAILCAAISVALGVHISTAHPTFERYYLLIVPFLSILSVAGIYWLTSALGSVEVRLWPVLFSGIFFAFGLFRALVVDENEAFTWHDLEQVAHKVDQVTPPGARVWGDEHIYFLTRRTPPTGMEHENAHKPLPIPADFIKALHILPRDEMKRQMMAGYYKTIALCDDAGLYSDLDLKSVYGQNEDVGDCTVYWDPKDPKP